MNRMPRSLFLDVNVWIDYYLDRDQEAHDVAMSLIKEATAEGIVLYTSAASLSELFYVTVQESKRLLRERGVAVDGSVAAAVRESAWAGLRNVMELSLIVPVAQREALVAMTYRDVHGDFEDDYVIATAQRVDADYLVTSDGTLIRHAPLACMSPFDMLSYMRLQGA